MSADDLTALALPAFMVAIALEAVFAYKQQKGWYEGKDTLLSLGLLALSAVIDLVPKAMAVWVFYQLYHLSPWQAVLAPSLMSWCLLFVLDDLIYYWFHRCNHEVRLFWAGHEAHHSARLMNFGTALRQGVGERIHKYWFWTPLPLLGFDPAMVLTMIALNLIYQFWVHTETVKQLPGWVEFLFNTPKHHRVHHAANLRYLDQNHGGVLIIWDRFFGTFAEEQPDDPPVYGLTKNLVGYNPFSYAVAGYQSLWRDLVLAKTWTDRIKILLKPPGWQVDGPDLSARQRRLAAGL